MARPLRVEYDGAWYHVMNRGAGRRPTFLSGSHRRIFLQLLGEISEIFEIEIHAYCMMGNHYHLLIRTPRAGLGSAMRHLDGVYTQRFNRCGRTDGPLFRGRYRSVLVEADSHLLRVSRYIHLNPVTAKIVTNPADYPDSSYRAYIERTPAEPWLHRSFTLTLLAAGTSYESFVEAGIDDDTRRFYERKRLSPVLGSERFRHEARRRVDRTRAVRDREVPQVKRLVARPSLSTVARAVHAVFGIDTRTLRKRSRERDGWAVARSAAAFLARVEGGHSLVTIGEWLGYGSYTGCSSAIARVKRMAEIEVELARKLERARKILRDGRSLVRDLTHKTET